MGKEEDKLNLSKTAVLPQFVRAQVQDLDYFPIFPANSLWYVLSFTTNKRQLTKNKWITQSRFIWKLSFTNGIVLKYPTDIFKFSLILSRPRSFDGVK